MAPVLVTMLICKYYIHTIFMSFSHHRPPYVIDPIPSRWSHARVICVHSFPTANMHRSTTAIVISALHLLARQSSGFLTQLPSKSSNIITRMVGSSTDKVSNTSYWQLPLPSTNLSLSLLFYQAWWTSLKFQLSTRCSPSICSSIQCRRKEFHYHWRYPGIRSYHHRTVST